MDVSRPSATTSQEAFAPYETPARDVGRGGGRRLEKDGLRSTCAASDPRSLPVSHAERCPHGGARGGRGEESSSVAAAC